MPDQKITVIISRSQEETVSFAMGFAKELKPGDVVFLYGELGSGKTVFVKGICAGLGVQEDVTSPSFVIVTEYQGSMKIVHIDLYRLPNNEANDLPIGEYMVENGVTLIEWADRLSPTRTGIHVKLFILNHEQRKIEIEDLRD
jgi:tRNA threonylcarbamoyladenosine biosynthesis protein TsaE